MSAISISMLTLGSFTMPRSSAAGWFGSNSSKKSDASVPIFLTSTTLTLLARSSSAPNVTVLRRYGSAPGVSPVDRELAMFSETIRRRVAWASSPEPAILEAADRGSICLPSYRHEHHAMEGLHQAGAQLVLALDLTGLCEFIRQGNGVAGFLQADFVAQLAFAHRDVLAEAAFGQMAGMGPRHMDRPAFSLLE